MGGLISGSVYPSEAKKWHIFWGVWWGDLTTWASMKLLNILGPSMVWLLVGLASRTSSSSF
jgi:hypothetical protein